MLAAMFGAIGNGTMLGAMLDANMKNGNLAMLAAIIAPQNNLLLLTSIKNASTIEALRGLHSRCTRHMDHAHVSAC